MSNNEDQMQEWLDEYKKDDVLSVVREETQEELVEAKIGGQNFIDGNVIQFKLTNSRDKNSKKLWLYGIIRGNQVLSAGGASYPVSMVDEAQLISAKPVSFFKKLRDAGDDVAMMP